MGGGGLLSGGLGGLSMLGGDALGPEGEDGLCCVCQEQPQDCVLQPCGHAAFCFTCVADLGTCPLCRQPVSRVAAIETLAPPPQPRSSGGWGGLGVGGLF